jgi:hypothetical protein
MRMSPPHHPAQPAAEAAPDPLSQVEKKDMAVTLNSNDPAPGFLKLNSTDLVRRATYAPVRVLDGGRERDLTLIQVRT